jgi:hypothetical protein
MRDREEILKNLEQTGERVHYKGRSRSSVQGVDWLWKLKGSSRHDVVRSCIGLHPHWDIYIINDIPYRKHSK